MIYDKDYICSRCEVDPVTGCWNWKRGRDRDGYGQVYIRNKKLQAHRFAYELWVGPTNQLHVCHTCDNPACVNPEHLFIGTHTDNMRDAMAKGRIQMGEAHWQSKLTEADVRAIRASAKSQRALAADFGVHQSSIWSIIHRMTWSSVI